MKFNIEDKDYEATKLTVVQLSTEISGVVKEELMKDAIKMGSLMDDPKDKSKFLRDSYTTLPGGIELLEKIKNYLTSVDGYQWIIKKSTGEDVTLTEDNLDSYISIVEFALGVEPSVDNEEDSDTTEGEVKKETAPLTIEGQEEIIS